MAETKRGRKSQSSYREIVGEALSLLHNGDALEKLPVLSQLPGVDAWVRAHPNLFMAKSKGLKHLLRQAIMEVCLISRMRMMTHWLVSLITCACAISIAIPWFEIAKTWQCSTVHVWRRAGHRAT